MKVSFGKAILEGKLRYASASAVQLARNCLRAYAYDKVEGRKSPSSPGQIIGSAYHAEAAQYHGDGDVAKLSPRLQAVLSEFPTSATHPHTFVDVPLVRAADPTATPTLADAPHIGGVPFIGEIDVLKLPVGDEPLEIIDYKFVKSFQYALTPFELAKTIQPTVYGLWANRPLVKLTYAYIRTQGAFAAQQVSATVTRAKLQQNADEIIIPTLHLMKAVAAAGKAQAVPGNANFCGNFGGCAHRAYCSVGNQSVLNQLFGENPVNFVIPQATQNPTPQASQYPAPVQQPVYDPHRAAVDQAKQNFIAAEVPPAPQPLPQVQAQGRVSQLVNAMMAAPNGGVPALAHGLALEYAQERQFSLTSNPPWLAGGGSLGQYTATTFEELEAMARAFLPQTSPTVTAPTFAALPAPAALPTPVPASVPVHVDAYPHLPAILPPDAPAASAVQPVTAALALPVATLPPVASDATGNANAAPQKPGRGRPPKAAKVAKAQVAPQALQHLPNIPQPAQPAQPVQPAQPTIQTAAAPSLPAPSAAPAGLQLFVNCMPEPIVAANLRSYVEALVGSLQTHYNVADLRNVTTKDHVLAYGGWRTVITTVARSNPPQGAFFVDVRGDEFAEAVVQGLRSLATMYVRGN